MRPLAIVCEATHVEKIRQGVARYCHPYVSSRFVLVVSVDTDYEGTFDQEKRRLIDWMGAPPVGATNKPLLCTTQAVAAAARLKHLASAFEYEVQLETVARLSAEPSSSGPPPLLRLLNQCGLSLRSASAHLLGHWGHGTVDRAAVDNWIEQFARLGPYKWIGEAILANTRLIEQAALGDKFQLLHFESGVELAVVRDPRGGAKSGEIIQNLLGKRDGALKIHSSPKAAIETAGVAKVTIFEDGLWSGTEAMGVIDSLLGERKPGAFKTDPLTDKTCLSKVEITLAYGIATDYGKALLGRFLRDKGLENINIWSEEELKVCKPELIDRMALPAFDLEQIRTVGPSPGELTIQVLDQMTTQGYSAKDVAVAYAFMTQVGIQLLDQYLMFMRATKGWSEWSEEKRKAASMGMHGLALTHAFGHSIPKAALPMLWGRGEVVVGSKKVQWKPLFPNAY